MQVDWTDPRDGTEWLVTLSRFGSRFAGGTAHPSGRFTIAFHRPGRRPCWTPYELRCLLSEATDQELMDLLDSALARDRGLVRPVRRAPLTTSPTAVPGAR